MTDTSSPVEYQLQYVRPNYGAQSHRMDKPVTVLGTELITNSWGDSQTVVWVRSADGVEFYRPVDHFTRTHPTLGEHYVATDANGEPQIKATLVKLYDDAACQAMLVLGTGVSPRYPAIPGVLFRYENDRPDAVKFVAALELKRNPRYSAVCKHVYGPHDSCPNCDAVAEAARTVPQLRHVDTGYLYRFAHVSTRNSVWLSRLTGPGTEANATPQSAWTHQELAEVFTATCEDGFPLGEGCLLHRDEYIPFRIMTLAEYIAHVGDALRSASLVLLDLK